MRTAEEILLQFYTREMSEPYGHVPYDIILKSINEARKEAIECCANGLIIDGNIQSAKNKILSLIDKLK